MATVKKLVTKMTGTAEQINSILTTGNGAISLGTTSYPDLNEFAPEYWQYHCPYGNPGDEIWLTEEWRISKVCQTTEGYTYFIEFSDNSMIEYNSPVSSPLTAANAWNAPTSATPDYAIRCKAVITNVSVTENQWVISVQKLA